MKYLRILLIALLLNACASDDAAINQSIFLEDPDFPGLPIYSELGYNTFGFYYNDFVVTSSTWSDNPLRIDTQEGETTFDFQGGDYGLISNISFLMSEISIYSLEDFSTLANNRIDLTGGGIVVTVGDDENPIMVENGHFEFTSIRRMTLDGEDQGVIISGTFSFNGTEGEDEVSLTEGRFDIRVDQSYLNVQ